MSWTSLLRACATAAVAMLLANTLQAAKLQG